MDPRRRNVLILGVTWALMAPMSSAIGVYSSLYVMELGGSPLAVGLLSMIGSVTMAFSRLIGGYLADSVGRKTIMAPMTVVYGLATALYAVAEDWTWLIPASFLTSLALMYQPSVPALLADSLPPEQRGRGLSLLGTVSSVLGLAGPPVAAAMVALVGLLRAVRLMYWIQAAVLIACGVARFFLVETLSERSRPSLGEALRGYLDSLRILRERLGWLIAVTTASQCVYSAAGPFIQVYAVKFLGLSPEEWGLIATVSSVVNTATLLPSGYLADRVGRGQTMALAYFTALLGFAALSASQGGFWWILASMVLLNAVSSWPPSFAAVADLTPTAHRGRMSAITGFIRGTLSGPSSLAGGVLYEVSPRGLMAFASLALVPVALGALKIRVGPSEEKEVEG